MFETTIQFKPRDRVAAGHDAGQAGRGARRAWSRCPGMSQHLGAADPQPHRHARHRHQEPGRHQGRRRRPRDDRPADGADRGGGQARSRACPRRWPSGSPAGATSTSTSTAPAAARYGLSVADVQADRLDGDRRRQRRRGRSRAASAIPINVRYPREIRDSLQRLRELPFVTAKGAQLLLQDVARVDDRGRPADAAQRERPSLGLGLRRRARPRSSLGRAATCRPRWRRR